MVYHQFPLSYPEDHEQPVDDRGVVATGDEHDRGLESLCVGEAA